MILFGCLTGFMQQFLLYPSSLFISRKGSHLESRRKYKLQGLRNKQLTSLSQFLKFTRFTSPFLKGSSNNCQEIGNTLLPTESSRAEALASPHPCWNEVFHDIAAFELSMLLWATSHICSPVAIPSNYTGSLRQMWTKCGPLLACHHWYAIWDSLLISPREKPYSIWVGHCYMISNVLRNRYAQ